MNSLGIRPPAKLSFTYNGKNYAIPEKEEEWGAGGSGLYINRPDIFNGTIYYRNRGNCTWYEPAATDVRMDDYSPCKLTSMGLPIDSVAVYLYESGSLIKNYKNCQTITAPDWVGGTITYQVCDVEGTFDLILKNKGNKTIVISDGKFQQNHVKQ